MSERKLVAAPALEASITGWAPTSFAPADKAVELRFLVGFAYKREDDPFYAVPEDEAAADAWFEERVARYRAWTETVAPLVKRCLAAAPGALDLYFLYQDLFFGARTGHGRAVHAAHDGRPERRAGRRWRGRACGGRGRPMWPVPWSCASIWSTPCQRAAGQFRQAARSGGRPAGRGGRHCRRACHIGRARGVRGAALRRRLARRSSRCLTGLDLL
ncbi:hypothetical protein LP419_39915 [Massilia sp. H-1]|nr:hypothetical protein LP419_39915 [Massilia sp. H-1]